MTDCNDTLRDLEAFLDGELSDQALLIVRQHLGGCLDCLQAFDFHAELRHVISAKCQSDEMPPGLLDRLEGCLDDDRMP